MDQAERQETLTQAKHATDEVIRTVEQFCSATRVELEEQEPNFRACLRELRLAAESLDATLVTYYRRAEEALDTTHLADKSSLLVLRGILIVARDHLDTLV